MLMCGLWVLLLVLGPIPAAAELINCAGACDRCGGPYPLDEQEIYCEMCRECDSAIAVVNTRHPTTKFPNATRSRVPSTTQTRDRRRGSEETVTHRIGSLEATNTPVRCNGNNKCFYYDKSRNRKIEFFCPEALVPFCDEVVYEKRESTLAGGFSTRLLCTPTLYCKERPRTSTYTTTSTSRRPTTTRPPLPTLQPPPSPPPPPIFLPPPPMPMPFPNYQMLPPPQMSLYQQQPPMPMMPPPRFPYYPQPPQLPPNFFLPPPLLRPPPPPPPPLPPPPPPPRAARKSSDVNDMRRLAKIMSNPAGPLLSEYADNVLGINGLKLGKRWEKRQSTLQQ